MDHADRNEDLIARWLAGELSPEEMDSFQQREDYEDLQAILKGIDGLELPPFDPSAVWEKLQERRNMDQIPAPEDQLKGQDLIQTVTLPEEETTPAPPDQGKDPDPSPVRIRPLFPMKKILAIAASLALLIALLFWLSDGDSFSYSTEISTVSGEKQKVTLPDESTVQINASSRIGYDEAKWPEERLVGLEGEGYFRVKTGQSFTVHSRQGDVLVVGTVFNVYAREKELEVKCMEGKVQVINPKGTERVLLKAGEQISVRNGRMQKRQGIDFAPKWFDGLSTFRSAPLEKVFGELERQYGVIVLGEEGKERSFSGKFIHEDLKKALKMVCDPMDLKYEISGDTVRVH